MMRGWECTGMTENNPRYEHRSTQSVLKSTVIPFLGLNAEGRLVANKLISGMIVQEGTCNG